MQLGLSKLFKEPLLQFIAIAFIFFYVVETFMPNEGGVDDPYTLDVSKETLIKFLQYQKKSFNAKAAESHWQNLSDAGKESLIADYVRDEVLFREALNLGLEEDDQIIRRRLIQKLDYVTRGFISDIQISEAELTEYFEANKENYVVDASITFTHVFFDRKKHEETSLTTLAQETLSELNEKQIPFENAPNFGDRFPFHRNYVDRTPQFVTTHFGQSLSEQVFETPIEQKWVGPFESEYGLHLVLVSKNLPSRMPELDEVAGIVLEDVRREKLDEARRNAVDKMISKYSVDRDKTVPAEKAGVADAE